MSLRRSTGSIVSKIILIVIHTTHNTGTPSYTICNSATTTNVPFITNQTCLYTQFLHYLHVRYLHYDAVTGATYNTMHNLLW